MKEIIEKLDNHALVNVLCSGNEVWSEAAKQELSKRAVAKKPSSRNQENGS